MVILGILGFGETPGLLGFQGEVAFGGFRAWGYFRVSGFRVTLGF